jgi:hypothetical protein
MNTQTMRIVKTYMPVYVSGSFHQSPEKGAISSISSVTLETFVSVIVKKDEFSDTFPCLALSSSAFVHKVSLKILINKSFIDALMNKGILELGLPKIRSTKEDLGNEAGQSHQKERDTATA